MSLTPFGRICDRIHLNPVHPVNPVKKIRQDNRIKQDNSCVNPWFQHKKNANSYTINLLETAKQHQAEWIYPFILIALETGMRRSEILSIKITNIDLEHRSIFLPEAKAGARTQPITKNLCEFLSEHLKTIEAEQEWLFPSSKSASGHLHWPRRAFRQVV